MELAALATHHSPLTTHYSLLTIRYSLYSGRRHFGNELIDQRLAERVEVLRRHHEGAWAADHVLPVVIFQAAGRIGVLRVPRERAFAQDHQAIDRDAFGERLVARGRHVAPAVVGAVA